MKAIRIIAAGIAVTVLISVIVGSQLAQFDYAKQDRENIASGPSGEHWLGTDYLGRDRLARLIHGTRVSLLLAPTAAALSLLLALAFGAVPGYVGGAAEFVAVTVVDLMLAVPWIFLLLMARAALPLNISPTMSVVATFLMLGLLGWGVPARVLLAQAKSLRQSDFVLLARATGISRSRLLWVQLLPNLLPILWTQFWITVPMFVLAEANLGVLGLGIAEPMPSLGSLLRDLEMSLAVRPDICGFSALAVLFVMVGSLQMASRAREVN